MRTLPIEAASMATWGSASDPDPDASPVARSTIAHSTTPERLAATSAAAGSAVLPDGATVVEVAAVNAVDAVEVMVVSAESAGDAVDPDDAPAARPDPDVPAWDAARATAATVRATRTDGTSHRCDRPRFFGTRSLHWLVPGRQWRCSHLHRPGQEPVHGTHLRAP
jgi:hypothetical protein